MNAESIKSHFLEAQQTLNSFLSDERNMQAIVQAGQIMVAAVQNGGKILSCGNGG